MTLLQHLHSRYMNTDLHRVWLNEYEGVAVFPVWNLSNQLVGYQQYRPDADKEKANNPLEGRYFTRVKDAKVGVWGLESWKLSDTLFVTEGVFDACRVTNLGYSAVATFGNDVSATTKSWLSLVRSHRRVVCVCDNDSAGRRLARYGTDSVVVEGYKDLGEASNEYVLNLLEEFA
jgi:hypothetical protein